MALRKEEIHSIFVDYYGEDRVDFQESTNSILVHWPEVTITNERNQSIVIWDLFAKVLLQQDGYLTGPPTFIRSTYNQMQWRHNYIHSHVQTLMRNNLTTFHYCCTGRGPINGTMTALRVDCGHTPEELANIWKLFCWELDKYVHVESIAGIPYNHLSYILNGNHSGEYGPIYLQNNSYLYGRKKEDFHKFALYFCKNVPLKFNFVNHAFNLAYTNFDFVMLVSNAFIKWYNSHPEIDSNLSTIVSDYVVLANKLYYRSSRQADPSTLIDRLGEHVLTFKGKDIRLKQHGTSSEERQYTVKALDPSLVGFLASRILTLINSRYGISDEIIKEIRTL